MSCFQSLCTVPALHHAWKTVKTKNAAGGIDGFSVAEFDDKLEEHLRSLLEELKTGKWNPEPYLRVEIRKNETEMRKLGLLTIKDKIVQQAIKHLVEPRFERLFLGNSYGYRPDRGHLKAVRRTIHELSTRKDGWVAKLDIDNYFDTIDHQLLFSRLAGFIGDPEIMRLIELSIKMGVVTKRLKWSEIKAGVPQGAVLLPLLANFYLHPFDQFVTGKASGYIRYADDFVMLADTKDQVNRLVQSASAFLQNRLMLKLNEPLIADIHTDVKFLGVLVRKNAVSISAEKKATLLGRIGSIEMRNGRFTDKSLDSLQGIKSYYAQLLPQELLHSLDEALVAKVTDLITDPGSGIRNVKYLKEVLKRLPVFSDQAELAKGRQVKDWTTHYLEKKRERKPKPEAGSSKNQLLINLKKREYRKRETEGAELVISTYGSFIGCNNKGITVKVYGKSVHNGPSHALEHITVVTRGVSISSDAIHYCMTNQIPVDFFDNSGKLYASILSPVLVHDSLWQQQSDMPLEKKAYMAARIVQGKLSNQQNLVKYFHKYHKGSHPQLDKAYHDLVGQLEQLEEKIKQVDLHNKEYATVLMTYEAAGAKAYWEYIGLLLGDDGIEFEGRVRQGASDLFNCLLNYGYALLYARVWQSVLGARLNPSLGVLHAYQPGKPTFVYDIVELFRAQAVDRIVIGLVQKSEPLSMEKGWLDEPTKKLLVQNLLERFNRYEKYRSNDTKFRQIITAQVREITAYIKGEAKSFKPYVAKW